ncbi:MAG: hypothetical protein DI613_09880 [Kocuria rhizophila]|uniref:hypothetical protein n=1 Tax=Kocuria carniphila TaxID=262208 RepID=UPI000DB29FBB|nr:MAG: hypothetical protein DI613_09880 [Kocuria rhizophila]
MNSADVTRFWSKVLKGPRPTDCWLWTGAIGDDGYGRFWIKDGDGQRMIRAHRFALATAHGGLAAIENLEGCHGCDTPLCVRPSLEDTRHVYLGTRINNMVDRAARGRHNRQSAAQFWRFETKQERAHKARVLRDFIREHGWDADQIDELLRGVPADQGRLF